MRLVPILMTILMRPKLSWLSWNGIALDGGGGFPLFVLCSLFFFQFSEIPRGYGEAGEEDNIAILQLKWLSGKMNKVASLGVQCLHRTPPAASLIAWKTTCATGRG